MVPPPIEAAGAVVWRGSDESPQVLLIHRGRYDDWTLPKGKLDPGEHQVAAAVREVREETGVQVRLGPRLGDHEYALVRTPGASKRVTYWCASPTDGHGHAAEAYTPNHEVDAVRWVAEDEARATLTYARDHEVLDRFAKVLASGGHRSSPLLVLRHAGARPRREWDGPDRDRPLAEEGLAQSQRLVQPLGAYGVTRVVTSDAVRCVQTVEPFVRSAAVATDADPRWSQEGANETDVRTGAAGLMAARPPQPTVLCTHRPVLPWVFGGLGLDQQALAAGSALVVHRLDGAPLGWDLLVP